jgi:hypothetical protein
VRAVADDFCTRPEGTLVVAPANDARRALNDAIHAELFAQRHLIGRARETAVFVERRDTTGADRRWATITEWATRSATARRAHHSDLKSGDYATVVSVDGEAHRITVRHEDGRTVAYDPNRCTV